MRVVIEFDERRGSKNSPRQWRYFIARVQGIERLGRAAMPTTNRPPRAVYRPCAAVLPLVCDDGLQATSTRSKDTNTAYLKVCLRHKRLG
ncbi:MAG: hypothetical protein U0Y68_21170 [Blastocatellia bacterium]